MNSKRYLMTALLSIGVIGLYPGLADASHTDTDISTSLDQLTGVWSSEGYGHIVQIAAGSPMQFQRYQINDVSCLLIDSGPLQYFHEDNTHILRNAENTRFTYMLSGNITTYAYNRLGALPESCRNGGTGFNADPLLNFDVLWSTFNENYAFFEQRGVNWTALRDQLRPQLTNASSDEELFATMVELLQPLCDGHVGLVSGFSEFNGEVNPNCWGGFLQHVIDEFGEQTTYTDAFEFFQQDFKPAILKNIEDQYVQGTLASGAGGNILWGDLGSGVGYLNILQLANYAGPDSSPAEDLEELAPVLDDVLASLADKVALVLDIRLNTGGYDHVALDIANRFVHQPRVAFTKKARWNNGFTARQAHVSSPANEGHFNRPIVILTSDLTASAAENFLLAMHSIPNVTIVGETTVGVHSDVLERNLPNGWYFSLSNEVYEDPDGTIFEGRGFKPDVEVESPRSADLESGRDYGIESALLQLAHQKINPGMNDAWYNPNTDGQGFFITVFPDLGKVSLAWFTYDTELPPPGAVANLGDPGHRWLTALGSIDGNQVVMNITLTSGGLFDAASTIERTSPPGSDGTLTLTFDDCNSGTVEYDIPSIDRQGSIPIRRVANDNIALCEALN